MPILITIRVNGTPVSVQAGTSVAAAIALAGVTRFRRSPEGQPRAPVCGMGLCFECRVTLNGKPHCRSCLTMCADGMDVHTDD